VEVYDNIFFAFLSISAARCAFAFLCRFATRRFETTDFDLAAAACKSFQFPVSSCPQYLSETANKKALPPLTHFGSLLIARKIAARNQLTFSYINMQTMACSNTSSSLAQSAIYAPIHAPTWKRVNTKAVR
jgi:hypothetical protein